MDPEQHSAAFKWIESDCDYWVFLYWQRMHYVDSQTNPQNNWTLNIQFINITIMKSWIHTDHECGKFITTRPRISSQINSYEFTWLRLLSVKGRFEGVLNVTASRQFSVVQHIITKRVHHVQVSSALHKQLYRDQTAALTGQHHRSSAQVTPCHLFSAFRHFSHTTAIHPTLVAIWAIWTFIRHSKI